MEDELRIERDRSGQVLELDRPETVVWAPPKLVGSMAELKLDRDFVPAAALVQKAKQFDDGLYAAVELAALHGVAARPGKTQWLAALRMALGASQSAVSLYSAARMLDADASVPESLSDAVGRWMEEFLADDLAAKPISFYTWTAELAALFRHDRALQRKLEPEDLEPIVHALHAQPEVRAPYESYLGLIERLTNPLTEDVVRRALRALDDGRDASLGEASLLPASVSHEAELIKNMFGTKPIPDNFELMAALISRVRNGSLDLRPTAKSGWFDHQVWFLEPMAVPDKTAEAERLRFTRAYREHLEDLLKSTWALARETHAKQLERPATGKALGGRPEKPKLYVHPDLSCEPLVTHYRRRASAYRFVRRVIEDHFGADSCRSMRRLTIDGPVECDLDAELTTVERLFDGAADRCERELGARTAPAGEAEDTFASWDPQRDTDLARDTRMMVPVFYDLGRRKTKVWAVLGWAQRDLHVSFERQPTVVVRDRAGADVTSRYDLVFTSSWHRTAFPEFAEVYVDRILDREEFRALCDEHGTRESILTAL